MPGPKRGVRIPLDKMTTGQLARSSAVVFAACAFWTVFSVLCLLELFDSARGYTWPVRVVLPAVLTIGWAYFIVDGWMIAVEWRNRLRRTDDQTGTV
jgi:hypothetical protein